MKVCISARSAPGTTAGAASANHRFGRVCERVHYRPLNLLTMLCFMLAAVACAADETGNKAGLEIDVPVEALGWMAGHWAGDSGGTWMEEVWLEPRGGVMVGMHRDLSPSGRVFFEFLLLRQGAEGVIFRASPGGGEPTDFGLIELEGQRAVFENPSHDFPQRIRYQRIGDALHAGIEGEQDGEIRVREWVWHRQPQVAEEPDQPAASHE